MKCSWLRWLGAPALAVAVPMFALQVSAQPADSPSPAQMKQRTIEVQGRVAKTGQGQFVVETRDNKQVTILTNPQTRFMMNKKAVRFADLRVGSTITVAVMVEGDRQIAETVTFVVDEEPAEGTLIEGQIVRVIGEDQVVVLTPERKEVIVFVDPRTTFQLENRTGKFTDLRTGVSVRAQVNVREGRHTARQIVVPRRGK